MIGALTAAGHNVFPTFRNTRNIILVHINYTVCNSVKIKIAQFFGQYNFPQVERSSHIVYRLSQHVGTITSFKRLQAISIRCHGSLCRQFRQLDWENVVLPGFSRLSKAKTALSVRHIRYESKTRFFSRRQLRHYQTFTQKETGRFLKRHGNNFIKSPFGLTLWCNTIPGLSTQFEIPAFFTRNPPTHVIVVQRKTSV